MEVAEAASGGPIEKTMEVGPSQKEEVNDGAESAAPAKPKVVRVKRKREQAPLENICKPNSYPFPASVDFSCIPQKIHFDGRRLHR